MLQVATVFEIKFDTGDDVPGELYNSADSEAASVYEYNEVEMQLDRLLRCIKACLLFKLQLAL